MTLLDGIRLAGKQRFVVRNVTVTGRINPPGPEFQQLKPPVKGCPCCHGGKHDEFPI